MIAARSIRERRSLVTEMLGDSLESTKAVINAMKSQCYKVKIVAVDCDVKKHNGKRKQNRRRHLGILFSGLPRALDSGSGKPKAVNYSLLLCSKRGFTQSSHHYETISDNNENVRFPVRVSLIGLGIMLATPIGLRSVPGRSQATMVNPDVS